MLHARSDYNRIQDPSGKIPADEPVMLFRAQDECFTEVCEFYARRLLEKYGNRKREMAYMILKHADLGAAWPVHKEPDLPESADKVLEQGYRKL